MSWLLDPLAQGFMQRLDRSIEPVHVKLQGGALEQEVGVLFDFTRMGVDVLAIGVYQSFGVLGRRGRFDLFFQLADLRQFRVLIFTTDQQAHDRQKQEYSHDVCV